MNVKFYTLLDIDIEEKRQWQGTVWTGEDRLKIFLRNAAVLNKSLTEFGGFEPLTILTNKPKHIQLLSEEIGYKNYNIKEIEFNLNVPKGIKFYSAHFKIDAFKFLSSCPEDEYSILMDNDIVLLRELPKAFHRIIDNGIPMVYHYHPYDIDRIMSDIEKFNICTSIVEWCGGEFMGGTKTFWETLYNKTILTSKSYFDNIDKDLFHVGDEMLSSISIAKMKEDGWQIIDAGIINLIRRYWGAREKEMPRITKTPFLHLPADKVWIGKISLANKFIPNVFFSNYTKHIRLFRFLYALKSIIGK